MLRGLINRVVGDPNEREIRKLQPLVEAANAREPEYERRSSAELRALTDQFRARLADGADLDTLLPEAFAAVREAAKRTVSMRHFDVQLLGGIVLHQGQVAEMKTGEGKTLVATLPVYLNALASQGVHLVTVNDYLARRDTLWMGAIYHLLGLSVGLLQSGVDQPAYLYDPAYRREPYPGLRPVSRQVAYAADVTYGTNNEFGFDYLRDNLAYALGARVQRALHYAIVDEVDNIFIDEARTPLIISGRSAESVEDYRKFAEIAPRLEAGVHYELDEKERTVFLNDEGLAAIERETGIDNIYDEANERYVHYMEQALKAQVLFKEGRDYIRQQKRIILIDPHTGRLMPDRRLSEGLHQAIEAKERVPVQARDMINATITIQNYFRMYKKLAGMSGTAMTEGEEFFKIYKLEVLPIPTNRPMVRLDETDVVYRSEEAKLRAVAREILACHVRGQPVLVGTTSVQMSERVSNRLAGEHLQMAGLAPRIALALQEATLPKEERARARQVLDVNLETASAAAWRKVMRDLGLEPSLQAPEHIAWLADYLHLPDGAEIRNGIERALREGIQHQVLNAKEHTREAAVIARAGEPGAVTIATNMAGRGVDIRLGGELSEDVIRRSQGVLRAQGLDPYRATSAQVDSAIAEVDPQYAKRRDAVITASGLHVLGTERHEARRIDNQLRGRSGRQGEPGSSRFFLSLEDDLMRRFGRQEMLSRLMGQMGDDFPIEHSLVAKTIERAQTSVEGYNFDIRKRLLDYDDVLSRQRETIYAERLRIQRSTDLHAETWQMVSTHIGTLVERLGSKPEDHASLFAEMDRIVPTYELEVLSKATGGAKDRRTLSVLRFVSTDEGFRTTPQGLEASKRLLRCAFSLSGNLSVFPPFTISFIADQLAGDSTSVVAERLRELAQTTMDRYGEHVGRLATNAVASASRQHDEQVSRQREILDSRIDDYVQLSEERGRAADTRGVAQYLERNFQLKVDVPEGASLESDQLREAWGEQITAQLHQRICSEMIDRLVRLLPYGIRLDRFRPALLAPSKLVEEISRIAELAAKQPRTPGSPGRFAQAATSAHASAEGLSDFVHTIKAGSHLDVGRLDRLVEHLLAASLDDLLGRFLSALDPTQTRLHRDIERLRQGLSEARRSGAADLLALLHEMNNLVYLEFSDIEEVLTRALNQEYDRWAQRQLSETEAAVIENPLTSADWDAIVLHLMTSWSVLKQGLVLPRLPFCQMAAALTEGMGGEELRDAILSTLQRASNLREQTWGTQELQEPRKGGAWLDAAVGDLPDDIYDAFVRAVGEQQLDDLRDTQIEDQPADLYETTSFVLAMQELKGEAIGTVPHAAELVQYLGQEMEQQLLDTPVGQLDAALQPRVREHLRAKGMLEDAGAWAAFMAQPIGTWDRRIQEEMASTIGAQQIESTQGTTVSHLETRERDIVLSYLRSQRRFIDEEKVQRFLVHQGMDDLPTETRAAALTHLAQSRIERLGRRKIANLDVVTRQQVLNVVQRLGLLSAPERRATVLGLTLPELGGGLLQGFGLYLARLAMAGDRTLGDLPTRLRESIACRLRATGVMDDKERVQTLASLHLNELGEPIASDIREALVAGLQSDLAMKTMEALPAETRALVHRALADTGYFLDPERVGWYERRTLAQLPSEVLQGLEQHLGSIQMKQIERVPFRDLPADRREMALAAMDSEGVMPERAERLRLTQVGQLADLGRRDAQAVARQLGRRWLARIRDQRPPALEDDDRAAVWDYVRDHGIVSDKDKEELFAYMRLEEFGAGTQRSVQEALFAKETALLDEQPIGRLPDSMQSEIRAHLARLGYFVDPARAHDIDALAASQLPTPLLQSIHSAFADGVLTDASLLDGVLAEDTTIPPGSLREIHVGQLAAPLQSTLWRYLDESGYFLDERRRGEFLEKRLADLGDEVLDAVRRDLVAQIAGEIGGKPVAELSEELRQSLRETVEAQGFFESQSARTRALEQPLGSLARADQDALALEIGMDRLRSWSDHSLSQLPPEEQQPLVAYALSQDWFLDAGKVERLGSNPLRDVVELQDLVVALCREQADRLRRRSLQDMPRAQQLAAYELLFGHGVRSSESQMRSFRSRSLGELDAEAYQDMARFLGGSTIQGVTHARVRDLDAPLREQLSLCLGRRIMSGVQRRVLLDAISRLWIDYLTDIEDLRRGIGLEAYGQRDPLVEYKRRAYELFEQLAENIRRTVVRSMFRQAAVPLEQ